MRCRRGQGVLFYARDKMLGHAGGPFPVIRCRRCGLVYLGVRPGKEAKRSFYTDDYAFSAVRPSVGIDRYRPVVEYLATRTPGRLLDVGTGNSPFLPAMRELGWKVSGTEMDPDLVAFHHSRYGVDVFLGELKELGFASDSFEAVTLIGVLEHVSDPPGLLAEVNRIMKPGGSLCLWGFNRSLEAALLGKYWLGFDPPRHFYSFSRETLAALLAQAGFVNLSWIFPPISYFQLTLVWAVRRARNRWRRSSEPIEMVNLPRLLNLLCRPVAILLSRVKLGSNMFVFAEKR